MAINIDNNSKALAIPAIFRLAFRPLFLGGTLFSVLALCSWILFWLQPFNWSPYGGPIWWHGHEMLFGFGSAIVAGFLLTAVQSWTGVIGIRGIPLVALAILWLLGRIVIAFDFALPNYLIATIDISFLFFVCIAMAYPIIKVKQWHNFMFIPILLSLTFLNALSHWAVLNDQYAIAVQSLHATVMLFTLVIAILGGRVIPVFTEISTDCTKAQPIILLERISIISIMLIVVIALIGFNIVPMSVTLIVSLVATVSNSIRFLRWGGQHCWSIPLLWSLHLAYAFIPLGLLMLVLHSIDLIHNISAIFHSFTVGSIGGMILAMISRVTLGHTGRPLELHPLLVFAFIFILTAAIIRVLMPVLLIDFYTVSIAVSGILWVLAFSIYLYVYAPMLLKSRIDGQPG